VKGDLIMALAGQVEIDVVEVVDDGGHGLEAQVPAY